jgi:glutaredoxin-related protein
MPRTVLDEAQIHPAIRKSVAGYQQALVAQARAAIDSHPVVVLGMAQNPFVRRARRLLNDAGITYQYIERGSYFRGWRERLALKMWAGWPTFPMVFVRGTLVGGATDVQRLLADGEFQRLLG